MSNGDHPRPAIEVGRTGARVGILVHPADGYGSTIGCINLSRPLQDLDSDISLLDSVRRVIDVIEDLRAFCGGRFKVAEDGSIQSAQIVISERAALASLGPSLALEIEGVFAPDGVPARLLDLRTSNWSSIDPAG